MRSQFPKAGLTELASSAPEAWAKESFEVATKIAYQNGALRGTPKGNRRECREIENAAVLPRGYAADIRILLAKITITNGFDPSVILSIPRRLLLGQEPRR